MEKKKQAWLYCAIDAPEDEQDTLKMQRDQLFRYAEQLGTEPVGSSSDLGGKPLLKRSGFQHFLSNAREGKVQLLLTADRQCLGRSSLQLMQLQMLEESLHFEIYTPSEGRIRL